MSQTSILVVEAPPRVALAVLIGTVAPFASGGRNGRHLSPASSNDGEAESGSGSEGARTHMSAIAKKPVPAAMVTLDGIVGDEHGSPDKHGGPEKVVHHYPVEHYRHWRAQGVTSALLDEPGAFGENLTTVGMTEETICVGDVYRVGGAGLVLQVSQVRQPCWKLNVRFDVPLMSANVQRACRTGWHYRALHPGMLAAGDELVLIDRPHPDWTLARLADRLYVNTLDRAALEEIVQLEFLADRLKDVARRRLETRGVESWEQRLSGR